MQDDQPEPDEAYAEAHPRALWYLFAPPRWEETKPRLLELYGLKTQEEHATFAHITPPQPTTAQLDALAAELGPGVVVRLTQGHGHVIYVPAGWPHLVITFGDCFKLAMEGLKKMEVPGAVFARIQQSKLAHRIPENATRTPPQEYVDRVEATSAYCTS